MSEIKTGGVIITAAAIEEQSMLKTVEVNEEEFRIMMAFRHQGTIKEQQKLLNIAIRDIENNPKEAPDATPHQVRALRKAAESLEETLIDCGFISPELMPMEPETLPAPVKVEITD